MMIIRFFPSKKGFLFARNKGNILENVTMDRFPMNIISQLSIPIEIQGSHFSSLFSPPRPPLTLFYGLLSTVNVCMSMTLVIFN